MKKAKERPKRRDCQLRHAAVLARTPRHHKRNDIGRAQVTKLQGKAICRIPAIQKWAQTIDIPLGRGAYQGTLHGQKAPVPVQNYACRTFAHRRLKGRSQLQPVEIIKDRTQGHVRLVSSEACGSAVA